MWDQMLSLFVGNSPMEKDIDRWLSFAARVETQLQTINNDVYSERYIAGISTLLSELRSAAAHQISKSAISERMNLRSNSEIQPISPIMLN